MKIFTAIGISLFFSLNIFAQNNIPSYMPTNGLVGWWPFNGNANDESNNGNNGTVNGATLTTDRFGISNKAYHFIRDLNQSINLNSINLPNDFAISCWYKKENNFGVQNLVSKYSSSGGYCLIFGEGILYAHTNYGTGFGDVCSTPWSSDLNIWHQAVLNLQTGIISFYIDGQLIWQCTNMNSSIPNTDMTYIGRQSGTLNENFEGSIDEIGIWNRALTPQEITALYQGASTPTITSGGNLGINTNTPHPSAALDITDTQRGLLIPRMTASQRNNISNPAEGLMVYQTNDSSGFWFYNVQSWSNINSKGIKGDQGEQGPQGEQGIQGFLPNGTTAGNTPFWNGTSWVTNNSNIYNNGGNVGIKTSTPNASAALEINSTNSGLLPPRMTAAQRDSIANPVAGLIVYCTNCGITGDMQYYDGSAWRSMNMGLGVAAVLPPAVLTSLISNISTTTITCGGNVTDTGSSAVSVRGVCWSTSPIPTVSLSTKTTDGSGLGIFESNLTNLSPNTTYYLRAYASNSSFTRYGNELSFTTSSIVLPFVNTNSVSNITQISATCGGLVSNDGGASVISRGISWSTSPNPTNALSTKTVDGTGIGGFSSSISGLTANTTYYVRAYASNSIGLSYGSEKIFTTQGLTVPVLTTSTATSITFNSALSGGDISSDGGSLVSSRGLCWDTLPSPTINNQKTTDGSQTGSFTSSLTGLVAGKTYYIRAYAVNGVGVAYGNEVSFTTDALPYIGQAYGGGIIFYIDGSGQHGLIAATSDQGVAVWGCYGSSMPGAQSAAIGTGAINTAAIMANCGGSGIAARLCDNLVLNGYSDWFLPSKDELVVMYQNRTLIGGFQSGYYWSSTEAYPEYAWFYGIYQGNIYSSFEKKYNNYYVRAVRAF